MTCIACRTSSLSIIYAFVQAFEDNSTEIFADAFSNMIDLFSFMPYRIFNIMENKILISVPLFILMGMILQKTRLAERLL